MATRIFKIKYVPHIIFLLNSDVYSNLEESNCVANCDMDMGEECLKFSLCRLKDVVFLSSQEHSRQKEHQG